MNFILFLSPRLAVWFRQERGEVIDCFIHFNSGVYTVSVYFVSILRHHFPRPPLDRMDGRG